MKVFVLTVVAVFIVLVAIYFPQNDNEKIISISYAGEFTNKLGRTIDSTDVIFSLPLYSNLKNNSSQLELRVGNQAESFVVSNLGTIVALETKNSNLNVSLSIVKPINIQNNYVYEYGNSGVDNLDALINSFQSSSSLSEFTQNNPSTEALVFLASTLSKKNHNVRVVSGVKLLDKVEQTPECWLQVFENNQWNDILADKTDRLPFKVILPQVNITEKSCKASLVEIWGLDVTDLKVTLTL